MVEVKTLRLQGHAAYDTCHYLTEDIMEGWNRRDANPILRERLIQSLGPEAIVEAEREIDSFSGYLHQGIPGSASHPEAGPGKRIVLPYIYSHAMEE